MLHFRTGSLDNAANKVNGLVCNSGIEARGSIIAYRSLNIIDYSDKGDAVDIANDAQYEMIHRQRQSFNGLN